ncbi:hypothetical protein ACFO0N_02370 [Halobium salinum]|uniref:Fluoride ion transporter CrcB n=1 Tax=Halobium salinum TaxID=1364940 RepID=A0ABD5P7S0_9EURY|nr:hypothetical protein [Halobium salinum]
MPDAGAPLGFDVATTLVGSGLTLLLTAGVIRYGDQVTTLPREVIYAGGGGALLVLGVLLGTVLVAMGHR